MSADEPSLDALALRHGTDKSSKVHGFARAYERHFAPLRHRPIVMLEIGLGRGASLRMWREYFSRAALYGLDVKDGRHLEAPGLRIFQGGQADADVLERLLAQTGPLDIVIDDGSHRWDDQIASFQKLYPHVQPGGYYVIEDLHTSYRDKYQGGPQRTLDFLHGLVHELNLHGRSGYGLPRNDPNYASFREELGLYERTLGSITFYKSIVFVQKKDADEM
jgi:hypothetical protein